MTLWAAPQALPLFNEEKTPKHPRGKPIVRLACDIDVAVWSVSLAMVIAVATLLGIKSDVLATVYLLTELLLLLGVAVMHSRREWKPGKAWARQVSQ